MFFSGFGNIPYFKTLGIEYDPQPPFDEGSPGKADPSLYKALKSRMVAAFEGI